MLLAPSLAFIKPNSSTTLPPLSIIPLSDALINKIDPLADKTNFYVNSYFINKLPLKTNVTMPFI
jgi:hypothetical protein